MVEAGAARRGPHRWCRRLERLVFALPVGIAGVFVVTPLVDRQVVLIGAAVAGGLLALGWTVALAAVVYLDATAVTEAGTGWEPSRIGYAATVSVFPVVALHYLSRRHQHVRPVPGSGAWWLAVPISTVVLLAPFVAVVLVGLPPAAVLAGPAIGLVVLPVAVYRDATYLRGVGADWQPDPASQFAAAIMATLLLLPQPGYVAYYLLRRRRA